ncbi:MAG TPA: NUDIX domain-containing protein [Streptosporangiaceae bacterium]|nr:NUDIX domain-containing protein [Streptosporangiaceae bacterium]
MPGFSQPERSLPDGTESGTPPAADCRRISCVGAVILDDAGRMLLILRGHDPGKGLWSIPGGRIEPGETDAEAVVREVSEETSLAVTCGAMLGSVERPGGAGAVLEIRDYYAVPVSGQLAAGDDANDARWVPPAEIAALDGSGLLTPGLLPTLREWGVLS